MQAETVNTAVYTLNKMGPNSVDAKTPFELRTAKRFWWRLFRTHSEEKMQKMGRNKWVQKLITIHVSLKYHSNYIISPDTMMQAAAVEILHEVNLIQFCSCGRAS